MRAKYLAGQRTCVALNNIFVSSLELLIECITRWKIFTQCSPYSSFFEKYHVYFFNVSLKHQNDAGESMN